jgi:hypothetical protein
LLGLWDSFPQVLTQRRIVRGRGVESLRLVRSAVLRSRT